MRRQLSTIMIAFLMAAALLLILLTAMGANSSSLTLAAPLESLPDVTETAPSSTTDSISAALVITGADFTGELFSASAITPLTVLAIDPDTSPNDVDSEVIITGTNFAPTPVVTLGTEALKNVRWVNANRLTALVPWGLAPDTYDLTVINPGPDAAADTLTDAFTATQAIGAWASGGPYGGQVTDLVLHPLTPTHIYASVHNSGLFFSTDAGEYWQPLLINPMVTHLAIDRQTPDLMYLGTHNDLKRTQNGGITWEDITPLGPTLYGTGVQPFAHPTQADVVYVTSPGYTPTDDLGGIFRSNNRGTTWMTITTGITDISVSALAFHPDNPDIMYAGTQLGNIFTTTNGGATWSWSTQLPTNIGRLAVNPFGTHELWAVADDFNWPQLYKSTNTQLTVWTPITPSPNIELVQSVTFHPTVSGTVWVGCHDGTVSIDGGENWQSMGLSSTVRTFAVDPNNPDMLYAGTERGVYKSDDGGSTWLEANYSLMGIVPTSLAVNPNDSAEVFASTPGLGLIKSENGGRTWQELDAFPPGPAVDVAVDPFTPTRVYFGNNTDSTGEPAIFISQDRGATWREVALGAKDIPPDWSSVLDVVAPHPALAGQIWGGVDLAPPGWPGDPNPLSYIYVSQDYGEQWARLATTNPISDIRDIAFDPVDPQVVYVAADRSGLLRSADGGQSWQTILAAPDIDFVEAVSVHPQDPNTIYAGAPSGGGGGSGVFVSTDAGASWTHLYQGGPVYELQFTLTGTPILYMANFDGLYRYDGQNWTRPAGLPEGAIAPSLAIGVDREGQAIVYVGTSGGEVTSGQASGLLVANSDKKLLGAGVYRQIMQETPGNVYLPLLLKKS